MKLPLLVLAYPFAFAGFATPVAAAMPRPGVPVQRAADARRPASCDHMPASIAAEAGVRGIVRTYGKDSFRNAETIAFRCVDRRLRYRNARIAHDSGGCALYQGMARDGEIRHERLLSSSGRPICPGA